MRIIAGQRRGHKIDGPSGRKMRPTSDLVREAIFNILRDVVEDRAVIDLFAGTGALGLEALSRGARRAIFIERDRANVYLIRRNLATLRYEDRATVIPTDTFRWVRSLQPIEDEPLVIFIDPPYSEYEHGARRVVQLLRELIPKLPCLSVIVLEAGRPLEETALPMRERWDVRRYGGTNLAILWLETESDSIDESE